MTKKSENLPAVQRTAPERHLLPAVQPRQYWASFDTESGPGRALMMRMMTVPQVEAESVLGQTLILRDVAGWGDTIPEPETGELHAVNYTCLVLADGTYIRTTGTYVGQCVLTIIQFFGEPPWKGIPVRLSKRKSRKGMGSYFVLEVVEDGQ